MRLANVDDAVSKLGEHVPDLGSALDTPRAGEWSPAVAHEARTDETRSGRPAFAKDFPADPGLDALLAAFDAGNFARVRQDAVKVIASSNDDAVKRAAEALLARTKPDPLAVLLLGFTALLLLLLSVWWITHDGPR